MKKMILITNHKCEKCDTSVHKIDKFCSNCGNDLSVDIVYEEDTKEVARRDELVIKNSGYR